MMDRQLLKSFIQAYPFQPATALWRAVEIGVLLSHDLPEGRGLDLGCGDGKLTCIIMDRAGRRRLVGIDPDPLETGQAESTGIYETVHTAPGDAVPEPDAAFDFVLSNSVLEHIPDLDPVLAEVSRVLRRGGSFHFTVPSAGFHNCLRGPILPGCPRDRYLEKIDRRLAHCRYYTSSTWHAKLAAQGLSLEQTIFYFDRAEVRRWETLSRFTGGLLFGLFGGRRHPIEIQRILGMRSVQARHRTPASLAAIAAHGLAAGLSHSFGGSLGEADAGCVLLVGRRR